MKVHLFKGDGTSCTYQHGSGEDALTCGLPIIDPLHVSSIVKAFQGLKLPIIPAPEAPQYFPGDARAVWQEHARLVAAKLEEKVGYGTAWQEQGYMGNLGRILSKNSRLKNLLWKDDCGPDLQMNSDESVLDTLIDLSALCALAIANIEGGNRWGR